MSPSFVHYILFSIWISKHINQWNRQTMTLFVLICFTLFFFPIIYVFVFAIIHMTIQLKKIEKYYFVSYKLYYNFWHLWSITIVTINGYTDVVHNPLHVLIYCIENQNESKEEKRRKKKTKVNKTIFFSFVLILGLINCYIFSLDLINPKVRPIYFCI